MRILVTGGAGFIGSHLCDRLLADSLATGADVMVEAEQSGELVGDLDGISFRHELARRAVESSLTAAERTQTAGDIASAAEELASTAEELSSQAEALQQLVAYFRVGDAAARPVATAVLLVVPTRGPTAALPPAPASSMIPPPITAGAWSWYAACPNGQG